MFKFCKISFYNAKISKFLKTQLDNIVDLEKREKWAYSRIPRRRYSWDMAILRVGVGRYGPIWPSLPSGVNRRDL